MARLSQREKRCLVYPKGDFCQEKLRVGVLAVIGSDERATKDCHSTIRCHLGSYACQSEKMIHCNVLSSVFSNMCDLVISWKNHVSNHTAPDNSTFDVAPALGLRSQGGDLKPAVLPGVACCTVITAARPRSVEWYLQVLRVRARHASLSTNSKHFQQFPRNLFWDLVFSLAVPILSDFERHPQSWWSDWDQVNSKGVLS